MSFKMIMDKDYGFKALGLLINTKTSLLTLVHTLIVYSPSAS